VRLTSAVTRQPSRIPVTILTGFLGSGKSTLVNRLLREQPGRRFGLVVNEFGQAALESQLIEAQRRPLFELPSGCVCCVSDGDLEAALKAVLKKDARVGHILVEASGLSSPGPLVALLTADKPAREFPFELGGVFGVVDASNFLEREPAWPAVAKQLAFADAVLLTKTDLVRDDHTAAVTAELARRFAGLKVFSTTGALPWNLLFEQRAVAEVAGLPAAGPRFSRVTKGHEAEVFEYRQPRALDPERLREVFAELPAGILRAKGRLFLHDKSGTRYKYLLQYTGAQKQLHSRRWEKDEPHQTDLVFIGTAFDGQELGRRLDACAQTAEAPS